MMDYSIMTGMTLFVGITCLLGLRYYDTDEELCNLLRRASNEPEELVAHQLTQTLMELSTEIEEMNQMVLNYLRELVKINDRLYKETKAFKELFNINSSICQNYCEFFFGSYDEAESIYAAIREGDKFVQNSEEKFKFGYINKQAKIHYIRSKHRRRKMKLMEKEITLAGVNLKKLYPDCSTFVDEQVKLFHFYLRELETNNASYEFKFNKWFNYQKSLSIWKARKVKSELTFQSVKWFACYSPTHG